jgi:hypothetical protein
MSGYMIYVNVNSTSDRLVVVVSNNSAPSIQKYDYIGSNKNGIIEVEFGYIEGSQLQENSFIVGVYAGNNSMAEPVSFGVSAYIVKKK